MIVAHASDVHVDHDWSARIYGGDGAGGLRAVLTAARAASADLLLLAGDTFDCHRLPSTLIEQTAATIREFELPIVLLPGNHDPAVADAVYHHPALAGLDGVHILGVTHDDTVHLPALDVEVWGRAHRSYEDMDPLACVPAGAAAARWRIVMAHGHYTPTPDRTTRLRPSWLLGDDEIAATGADYVALGHWNRRVEVGRGEVAAWYSGSPDFARSINVVRLAEAGGVTVGHAPLDLPLSATGDDTDGT